MTVDGYGDGTYGAGTYGGVDVTTDPRWVVMVTDPSGAWVDVSCDARDVAVEAARSSFVEAFSATVATVTLANFDGRFSTWTPDNVWLRPGGYVTGVPIRIGVAWGGTIEWRFTGTTDRVDEAWPGFTDAMAVVTATDGFKALARNERPIRAAVGAGELSGARVARVLDDAGWVAPRRIDAGTAVLAATTLAGFAIDQLRIVGEAEWGWLYVAGDGALVFRQRDATDTDPRMTAVQYTFTDTHTEPGACYADATTLAADEERIINRATVTATPGGPQLFEDAPSVAQYGARTWTRDDLPLTSGPAALGLAQAVVETYASDAQRVDRIVVDAAGRPDAWPAGHGARIGDRVRFVRVLPGGGQVDAELLVMARSDRMTPTGDDGRLAGWQYTLTTADAAFVAGVGQWDVGLWDESLWGI